MHTPNPKASVAFILSASEYLKMDPARVATALSGLEDSELSKVTNLAEGMRLLVKGINAKVEETLERDTEAFDIEIDFSGIIEAKRRITAGETGAANEEAASEMAEALIARAQRKAGDPY